MISDWISEQTNGTLERSPSNNPLHIMSIINAVYLKSGWERPFKESNTQAGIFQINESEEVEVDFMRTVFDTNLFVSKDFKSISIRLKDIGKMTFYLPNDNRTVQDLLEADVYNDMLNQISTDKEVLYRRVNLYVPKFSYKNSYSLGDAMQTLGMEDAFEDYAEFNELYNSDANEKTQVKVEKIEQKTYILVDEYGCEASAYTEIQMYSSSMPAEPETFKLDRPFIYTITTNENVLLFVGIINNPSLDE